MKKKLRFIIALYSFAISFSYGSLLAQDINISVDNFTGTGIVNIPIFTIQNGAISVPLSLLYSGSGVRVKDVEGSAGMNWNLVAGGEIRREVRGLPDDIPQNYGPTGRSGWLHNINRTKVNDFTILNDDNISTCLDEETDLSYLAANSLGSSDTEPDIFYVNVPGLNCQFVFDKNLKIRTIPDIGAKITYTVYSAILPTITSFTVTNDKGMRYVFDNPETTVRRTSTSQNVDNIGYFKREYDHYFDGLSYSSAWKLTSISDNMNLVQFVYSTSRVTTASTRLNMAFGTDTTLTTPFSVEESTSRCILDRIYYNGADAAIFTDRSLKLEYRNVSTSSVAVLSRIIGKNVNLTLAHVPVKTKEIGSVKEKTFLKGVFINRLKIADFDYYGISDNVIDMPDSLSTEIDQWGYYNGSGESSLLPAIYINPNSSLERYRSVSPGIAAASFPYHIAGAVRATNASKIINGSLKSIKHQYGGTSILVYEPNDYSDPTSGAIVQGGGIRVKQIIDDAGNGAAGNMIRNYSYNDPSTNKSSGKPISLPLLAFTRPYTGAGTIEEKWQKSVVRLEETVSGQSKSIVYPYVKISQAGAGSTLFEYTAPATTWQSTIVPDWTRTFAHVARPSCVPMGLMTGQFNGYPFAVETDFDFERGLLKKVIRYNENNEKVSESINTYARSAAPVIVQGLRYENIGGITAYSKYNILTQTGNQLVKTEDRQYLPPSVIPSQTTIVENFYESMNHKLLTMQKTSNSDGSTLRLHNKYVKDYLTVANGQEAVSSLNLLHLANANLLVETYLQVERNGINKTLSGTLTKFKGIEAISGETIALPDNKLQFINQDGLSDFQVSGVSGGNLNHDRHYTVAEKYIQYSNSFLLVSTEDSKKNISTVLMNQNANGPIASIKNARGDEVYFNDFDVEDIATFELPNSEYDSLNSRSGKYHMNLIANTEYNKGDYRNISRNAIADHNIFSVWIRSRTSGNLILTLTDLNGTPHVFTLPYLSTNDSWKYHRLKLAMTGLTTAFTMKYKSTASIAIDDVLLYPEQAEVNTVCYHPDTYLKDVETDGNGISTYYNYDKNKRLLHVMDQDKNIILKKAYVNKFDVSGLSADFTANTLVESNFSSPFSGSTTGYGNMYGLVYNWDFGDGHSYKTMDYPWCEHEYSRPGTYAVTFTVTSPYYSTVSTTKNVVVYAGPVPLTFSYPGGGQGSLNVLSVYEGATLSHSFLPISFGSDPGHPLPIITQAATQFRFSVTGAYHASKNPTGFKNIQVKMYNSANELTYMRCIPYNNTPYKLDVNLIGVKRVDFSLITDGCELMD